MEDDSGRDSGRDGGRDSGRDSGREVLRVSVNANRHARKRHRVNCWPAVFRMGSMRFGMYVLPYRNVPCAFSYWFRHAK